MSPVKVFLLLLLLLPLLIHASTPCLEWQVGCPTTQRCISRSQLCDGDNDCDDWDERPDVCDKKLRLCEEEEVDQKMKKPMAVASRISKRDDHMASTRRYMQGDHDITFRPPSLPYDNRFYTQHVDEACAVIPVLRNWKPSSTSHSAAMPTFSNADIRQLLQMFPNSRVSAICLGISVVFATTERESMLVLARLDAMNYAMEYVYVEIIKCRKAEGM